MKRMSVSQMSERFKIAATTIRDAIKGGRLKAVKFQDPEFGLINQHGYVYLIEETEATRFAENPSVNGRPRKKYQPEVHQGTSKNASPRAGDVWSEIRTGNLLDIEGVSRGTVKFWRNYAISQAPMEREPVEEFVKRCRLAERNGKEVPK